MVTMFRTVGRYCILLTEVFRLPEKWGVFRHRLVAEMDKLGLQSVGIVALLSLFMGAVVTLQTAAQIDSGWIPKWTIGFTTRQTMILEFSPTIISLILAGKVGGNIASEIGTMRVKEEIDALQVMGVNSASFLILPKILAAVILFPFLVVLSMALGITAGAFVGENTGVISMSTFEYGVQYYFEPYQVRYALQKTMVFAFLITSISSFHGYFAKGGALGVGVASTRAVVYSDVFILVANYILTQLLLT